MIRVQWYFYGAIEISFSHSVDNRNNGCQECCENQYCKDNHGDDEEKDLKSWRRGTAVIAVKKKGFYCQFELKLGLT